MNQGAPSQATFASQAMFFYKCGPNRSNFGDLVGPYLYRAIMGTAPLHVDVGSCRAFTREPLLVTCGSLLQNWNMRKNWHIWGSGIYRETERLHSRPAKVYAVRGPLSRNLLLKCGIACPEVYGDPALLLPRFYNARRSAHTYRIGLLPHYTGYEKVKRMFGHRGKDVFVIDVDRAVEKVCDDIASCEATFSGSLHGIVVSHAYGVDCAWAKREGHEIPAHAGDGVKYRDYYASVGRTVAPTPIDLSRLVNLPIEELVAQAKGFPGVVKLPNLEALLKACPFGMKK